MTAFYEAQRQPKLARSKGESDTHHDDGDGFREGLNQTVLSLSNIDNR
jgi:hypothetical protein